MGAFVGFVFFLGVGGGDAVWLLLHHVKNLLFYFAVYSLLCEGFICLVDSRVS